MVAPEKTPLSEGDVSAESSSSCSSSSSSVAVGPDGGYGWVIVGCSFLCIFTIDGIVTTYSLLLPELNRSFQTTPALTSMGNSLILGIFLLMGIPTSCWITKYGCRPVAFIGACLAATGLVISSITTSIWPFLLTYGIIGGVGIGMVYLPSVLMVNTYFNRKRGIAQGIVTSGSGIGILVLAPLVEILLDNYGWRGAVMISAGFILQLCICALLMRPLYVSTKVPQSSAINDCDNISLKSNDFSKCTLVEQNIPSEQENSIISLENMSFNINSETYHVPRFSRFDLLRNDINPNAFINPSSVYNSTPNITVTKCQTKSVGMLLPDQYLSMQCIKSFPNKVKKEIELNPLSRKDIFHSGSITKLKQYDSHSTIKEFEKSMTVKTLYQSDESCITESSKPCAGGSRTMQGLCDRSLLTNRAFLLLATGAMLTQMGQYIPMVFLGDYALQIGLERTDVSIILAVFGVVNTLARLLAGILTNVPKLTPLLICNVGTFACAVTLFLFSLCTTFWTLCTFAICLAFFSGFFPPLQPLMVLDYLGLDRLTSAFGLITFAKGPAAIFGPPLAGNLYLATKSYAASNAFSGGLFFISALVQTVIPLCHKPEKHKTDQEFFVDSDIPDEPIDQNTN